MEREVWTTRLGFVLASIGSAIGLGNIWRFGYLVYSNGGGAFLIPYFLALFITGISLMILEFSLGHYFKVSAPMALREVKKKFEWVGWWAVLSGFIITTYYVVVISWALVYLAKSVTLAWGEDTASYFFRDVLQLSDDPWDLNGFAFEVLIATVAVWFLNWLVDFKGVKRGIEAASFVLMPLLWLLAAILVLRAVTLPGAFEGINWYLKPDFGKLSEYSIWLAAFGQIFFSLSLGMGVMITYASYLPKKSDLATNAFIVSLADSAFSILIGFAIFGTLGYMSFVSNTPIQDLVSQSVGLAFIVFPKALNMLPALNNVIAAVFFLALVIAGLSSSISLVEAFSSAIMDKFGISRKMAVNIVIGAGFLGSLIYTTRAGLYWLDVIDHFINYYGLLLVGLLEVVAASWFFDLSVLKKHVNEVSKIKVGSWWDFALKFFTPSILALLLIMDIAGNLKENYGGYATEFLLTGFSIIVLGMLASAIISWKDKNV